MKQIDTQQPRAREKKNRAAVIVRHQIFMVWLGAMEETYNYAFNYVRHANSSPTGGNRKKKKFFLC